MTQVFVIYCLCLMNFILIGISDAAGRNPLIFKRKYYFKVITHSIIVGHVLLTITMIFSWALWSTSSDPQALWESFISISYTPVQIFVIYVSVVLITFLFYAIPNSEIRSLVTVASFGPLTMIKSPIVVIGWLIFVSKSNDWRIISIWTLGTFIILSQKALLNFLGFARLSSVLIEVDRKLSS